MAPCFPMVRPVMYFCVLRQCCHCIIKGLLLQMEGSTPLASLDICYSNVIPFLSVDCAVNKRGLFIRPMDGSHLVSL